MNVAGPVPATQAVTDPEAGCAAAGAPGPPRATPVASAVSQVRVIARSPRGHGELAVAEAPAAKRTTRGGAGVGAAARRAGAAVGWRSWSWWWSPWCWSSTRWTTRRASARGSRWCGRRGGGGAGGASASALPEGRPRRPGPGRRRAGRHHRWPHPRPRPDHRPRRAPDRCRRGGLVAGVRGDRRLARRRAGTGAVPVARRRPGRSQVGAGRRAGDHEGRQYRQEGQRADQRQAPGAASPGRRRDRGVVGRGGPAGPGTPLRVPVPSVGRPPGGVEGMAVSGRAPEAVSASAAAGRTARGTATIGTAANSTSGARRRC